MALEESRFVPSPIAHTSIALLAWPPLRGDGARPLVWWRRLGLLGLLLLALQAPDLDILIDPLMGRDWFAHHGGPMHSLGAGLLFGVLFAGAARLLVRAPLGRLWTIGVGAYWSHVLLDACTYGRGVMLLWPISSERMGTPVPLFVGVRHGDWSAWPAHTVTVGTEVVFAAGVWLIARGVRGRAGARELGAEPVCSARMGESLS